MTVMTVKQRALDAVLKNRDEHARVWRGELEPRWTSGLMEEVGELAAALEGRHEHTPDHELVQIAAICLNWLEYRMQTGWGEPGPEVDEGKEEALLALKMVKKCVQGGDRWVIPATVMGNVLQAIDRLEY